MNILKLLALLAAILASAQVFAADPRPLSPTEQRAAELEAEAKEARKEVAKEKELARAAAKAEWAQKSHLEAWSIRGQSVVDAVQYAGGKTAQGLATVDGYIGAGVAYPVNLVTAGAFAAAEGSKSYAAKAWDNKPKTEVALRVGETEVKVDVQPAIDAVKETIDAAADIVAPEQK